MMYVRLLACSGGDLTGFKTANQDHLKASIEIVLRSQKHCVELGGLLEQLKAGLENCDVTNVAKDAPSASLTDSRDTELAALREELAKTKQQQQALTLTIEERDAALRSLNRERTALSKLLEARSAELDAAQAFLPTPDTVADAHIIELVNGLNYEIANASATLAYSFEKEARRLPLSKDLSAALEPSVKRVGKPIATLLSSRDNPPDLALPMGFQAFLARICKLEIGRWVFRPRAPANAMLNSITTAMRARGTRSLSQLL